MMQSTVRKRGMHVQEALELEEGEVETWVIRASGRKLLEARIDQLRGRVAVTRIPQRTFTADQWRQLTAQLGAWKVWALHLCSPCTSARLKQGCCIVRQNIDGRMHVIYQT